MHNSKKSCNFAPSNNLNYTVMKKSIVFAFIAVILVACSTNEPDKKTERENYGKIVGTWECLDVNYENLMHGYFVLINDTTTSYIPYQNAYLCFNIDVQDSLPFRWGEWAINPIELPYDFMYKTVEYGEEGYTYFGMSADNTFAPMLFNIETQVLIFPKE